MKNCQKINMHKKREKERPFTEITKGPLDSKMPAARAT